MFRSCDDFRSLIICHPCAVNSFLHCLFEFFVVNSKKGCHFSWFLVLHYCLSHLCIILSYCSSASMHAWDKISSFQNGRSSLNSSALQTCDKCKSSICGRIRSSAGLQFLNVAKVPHQYQNLPFWFMESMLEGVSSMKSVWKRIQAKTGNDYVDRKL